MALKVRAFRILVTLLWHTWPSNGVGAGVIRSVIVKPLSCQLQPQVFEPQKTFYVVDCPYQAQDVTLAVSSAFHILGQNGEKVALPVHIPLAIGQARPVYLHACSTPSLAASPGSCTLYVFDVHRKGSSEAALAQLSVTGTGGTDTKFTPTFSASFTTYQVSIPYSQSAEIMVQAVKNGFVSFDSYRDAAENTLTHTVNLETSQHQHRVEVFVVSSDRQGRAKYILNIEQRLNTDAELRSIKANIGILRPPLSPHVHQYRLEVPKGTLEVALSARTHDRKGAEVSVNGGAASRGYASSLVSLPVQSPYALVRINVRAADGTSQQEYTVVVLNQGGKSLAMLQSLSVGQCVGGLRPPFRMFKHHYRCNLDRTSDRFRLVPTGLWMPKGEKQTTIQIWNEKWSSGKAWIQPLDDAGHAEVRITVVSADGSSRATYIVSGMGYSLAERHSTTSTTTTTFTTTTQWSTAPALTTQQVSATSGKSRPAGQPSLAPPYPGQTRPKLHGAPKKKGSGKSSVTTTVTASVMPTTAGPWWVPQQPSWRFPTWNAEFRPPDPTALIPSSSKIDKALVISAFMAFFACEGLAGCLNVLKHLQFVAISSEVASPQGRYWNVSQQLGVLNLWFRIPGIRAQPAGAEQHYPHFRSRSRNLMSIDDGNLEDDAVKSLSGLQERTGHLVIFTMCLPFLVLLLLSGYRTASREEALPQSNLLSTVGIRSNRVKALPCALFVLDIGILGFTDAVSTLLFSAREIEVKFGHGSGGTTTRIPQGCLFALLVLYPAGYAIFCFVQLCRLLWDGRLVWSSVLGLFADARSLAVALRGPWFTAWSLKNFDLGVLGWLCSSEYRSVVPISGVDGTPLQLGDAKSRRRTADGRVRPADENAAEVEAGLLRSKPIPAWQRRQKQLALLHWMERRAAVYATIKQQIKEAERFGMITEVHGHLICDVAREPLFDMYQYCVYQFPRRPWNKKQAQAEVPTTGWPPGQEPVESETGEVFASWVPKAAEISRGERKRINAWLDEWLLQAEIVERTRQELRLLQFRGYDPASTQGEQAALLREMALSLLDGQPLQSPLRFSPDEAEDRDTRLAELVQERERWGPVLPWEFDRVDEQEAAAIFCTDLVNSDLFLQALNVFMQPAFKQSAFAFRRILIRLIGEDPGFATESGVASAASLLGARVVLAVCPLRLSHVSLLSKWMPPFSFNVPYDSLRLPVREHWTPLFASGARPSSSSRQGLLSDVLERIVGVAAVVTFRRCATIGWRPHNISGPALVLTCWSFFVLLLRYFKRNPDLWQLRVAALQLVLCIPLLGFGHDAPIPWCFLPLDTMSTCILAGLFMLLCWCSLRRFIVYLYFSSGRSGRLHHVVDEWGDVPSPMYGSFYVIGGQPDGKPLPLALVVPSLGLFLPTDACKDPGACTDESRVSVCQKRFAVYEGPPARVRGFERPINRVQELERFAEIRDVLPVVASRAQFAGTEELRELVCTIHVVNHAGCEWSSLENDSFLSLFKPWGLSSRPSTRRDVRGSASDGAGSDIVRGLEMTEESPMLLRAWRKEVLDWLHGELAATSETEYTALDVMLDGGAADRGEVKREGDRRVVPGIFSDDALGCASYKESRCFAEGRVLHYVILSDELKAGLNWRPDPLSTHEVTLRTENMWRPCLLRLASRGITYTLKKTDGRDYGGPFPEWPERVWQDLGDHLEYSVPFIFVERVIVDEDAGMLTFHGRDLTPGGVARPGIENSPRRLPLVFSVGTEMAEVWEYIVKQYGMSSRMEHIINYSGPVVEHPHIPGVVCRHGPEGEQLWDDGKRYIGPWSAHVYHGRGELLDARSDYIYRGEWQRGMKHGEGTFYFSQTGIRRVYEGQWVSDEFCGAGELRVADDSVEELRRSQPHSILRFRGRFNVAEGQFLQPPDLMQLEPEKHSRLIQQYFPLGPSRSLSASGTMNSTLLEEGFLQFCGAAPRDFAAEFYGLDGNDVRHCGPDGDCEIQYADGTVYRGPCSAAAIPDGLHGQIIESNGTQYEGPVANGLRQGAGMVTLANGSTYEGTFQYPGGKRHGNGHLIVHASVQPQVGIVSYEGQYVSGLREGEGEVTFTDSSTYQGEFRGNLRHGSGILIESETSRYEGPWDGDLPGTGWADIQYQDGHRYLGDVSAGRRHGEGELHAPRGTGLDVVYSGQWKDDVADGAGTLTAVDGQYIGQFRQGLRHGTGRFEYSPQGENGRYYEGSWENDQPHGTGTYMDEYSYLNEEAEFENGAITSDRRPPAKGMKEKYRRDKRWPTEFLKISVELSPNSQWPKGSSICASRGKLTPTVNPELEGIDTGVGYANGRSRPAHMGLEGVPGSRWA